MVSNTNELKHSLYNLSNDYESLWNLVQKGHIIAGYKSYGEVWDLIEIKLLEYSNEVYIGVRGNGSHFDDYDRFKTHCETINLQFITNLSIDITTIHDAAYEYVFVNSTKNWSNNNNEAGDNYGSFVTGALWVLNHLNSK